jgi:hypothetical protein
MPPITPECVGREAIFLRLSAIRRQQSKRALLIHSLRTLGHGRRPASTTAFLRSQLDFEVVAFTRSPVAELAHSNNLCTVSGIGEFRVISNIFEIVEPTKVRGTPGEKWMPFDDAVPLLESLTD